MKVLSNTVWKCLQESKLLDIGLLRPSIPTQLIAEVVEVVGVGLKRPANLPQVIAEVMNLGQV